MQTSSKPVFHHNVAWADFTTMALRHPYLHALNAQYKLHKYPASLSTAALLNQLVSDCDCTFVPRFVEQGSYANDPRYYEQIIAEDDCVPTRANNWHDFFNGLIWLQFPQSKRVLNRLHMEDINQFGVNPRTARRNRITHFDECGLVLVCHSDSELQLLDDLACHRWTEALYEQRKRWSIGIKPWVFGHANLEMLLNPFLQLTAKWTALRAPSDSTERELDTLLQQQLSKAAIFDVRENLKPLPLLGIPGWAENQTPEFYANVSVFRPPRRPKH
ncbi:DUF3025 domain-containing protein [Alteromonas sp. ASW11-36]|uniref:DUF3025 domain-containing protein n=1 Tax=Alteromonas arenosi TaxID=3055817 RepID=A0ABT7SUY7_9ALTE|nr:DUF3025 domain-containing protein [Alteromonas sp. ASW11-36]MDM7860007.1 DUF3025 domain-containing protein [Alteromonas sp. ASW11-36]